MCRVNGVVVEVMVIGVLVEVCVIVCVELVDCFGEVFKEVVIDVEVLEVS